MTLVGVSHRLTTFRGRLGLTLRAIDFPDEALNVLAGDPQDVKEFGRTLHGVPPPLHPDVLATAHRHHRR